VGICEEFERSARLLCGELGWHLPQPIPHENRTLSGTERESIDPETIDTLRDYNRLDLELYTYGVDLFRAHAKPIEPNRLVPFPIARAPDRRAVIRSASAIWAPGENSRLLELTVRFQAKVSVAELSLGVQINDAAGKVVWGTSTSNENLVLNYQTNCDSRATFFVQCDLPRGLYFLTVALSEPRRLGFQDHWIDRAALFEVAPPRAAAGPYVRGMKLQEFRSITEPDAQRIEQDAEQLRR